jgi:hypothetical protein
MSRVLKKTTATTASRIWEFIQAQGTQGAIADEVLAKFPSVKHTTVTARIHALKHSGLIVRHPEKKHRKTRSGRHAEVWVVPRGAQFKNYREPQNGRLQKPQNVAESVALVEPCNLPHVTEAERELLALARKYGEADHNDTKIDDVIDTLFNTIVQVYPPPKKGP